MSDFRSESLWKDGVCLGSAFFGGVLGNIAAGFLWEVGKFALRPLLEKVPSIGELLSQGGANKNHDLLRALRCSECHALIAIIDQTLLDDYGLRSGQGSLVERLSTRLKARREPDLALLCELRRQFRTTAAEAMKLPIDDLAQVKVKSVSLLDVAAVISTGSEILQADSADDLRERSLTTYLKALERSIQPRDLPIGFKQRFSDPDKGWFPLLRVCFREELKTNEKARIAFELDCQSLIPQMLGKSFRDVEQRLDKQDAFLTATFNELRDFRSQFDEAVGQIVSLLDEINATIQSTHTLVREIHGKIVKTDGKKKEKLPQEIRDAINRGVEYTNSGHFEKARAEYQSALDIAEKEKHALAMVDAKEHLAFILIHADNDLAGAKILLQSCLDALSIENDDQERAKVLERLAQIHEREGDWEMSENVQRQALALSENAGDKVGQGATLVSLAWTVGRGGRTDEALQLNKRGYELLAQSANELKADDTIKVEFVNQVIANLFFQRAKIHQRRADPDEAETALETALKWQRKVRPNHELAKLLQAFAELKLFRQKLQDAANLLHEAAKLYDERHMLPEFAECLHLMGRIYAGAGNFKKAGEFLSGAARAANESGQSEEAAEVLLSLAALAREQEDFETAQSLYRDAMNASSDRRLQAKCLIFQANLAKSQGDEESHKKKCEAAIVLLRDELAATKSDAERTRIHFELGCDLREIGKTEEALDHARKAREGFERTGDAHGAAKAAFEMAGSLDRLQRRDDARRICLEVQEMIEGKPFYDIAAALALSFANFDFHSRNFADASRHIEESLALCKEHDLPLLPEALLLKDRVEHAKHSGTETGAALETLLDGLHEQLALCPANKEGYVRLWIFCHGRHIGTALDATLGPNIAVLTDDLNEFTGVSSRFKPYRDWSFVVPTSAYPENILEVVPFTGEMVFFPNGIGHILVRDKKVSDSEAANQGEQSSLEDVFTPRLRHSEIGARLAASEHSLGAAISRYHIVDLSAKSEEYGGAKGGAFGPSLALPDIVHKIIQNRPVEELKRERWFFLYYNRAALDEGKRLWHDLAIMRSFRCFPVYQGALPKSKEVRLVASCPVTLPIFAGDVPNTHKRAVRGIRKAMLEVFAASASDAASKLAALSADAEDLLGEMTAPSTLNLRFYVMNFDDGEVRKTGGAIVLL